MHVFTYGTLQVEVVWLRVAGKAFATLPAVAHGFRCRRVQGTDYPAIVRYPDESTAGLIYLDVDEQTVDRLDRFEGKQYNRLPIDAISLDGQALSCQAYVFAADRASQLTNETWSLAEFRSGEGLRRFTNGYIGFDQFG